MKNYIFVVLILLTISAVAQTTTDPIMQAYHKSFDYEKTQNYDDAISVLLPILKDYPNGFTVNLRLGWLYYLNGNFANSLRHYEKAITVSPYALDAKVGHLLPLMAQQKFEEVENEAFQILNTDYYNYYANLRLLYALRMQEKWDVAEKVVIKMLTVYPIDTAFLNELALIKQGQGDESGAQAIFYQVIILDPYNAIATRALKKEE